MGTGFSTAIVLAFENDLQHVQINDLQHCNVRCLKHKNPSQRIDRISLLHWQDISPYPQ